MAGKFIFKSKLKMSEISETTEIQESDFSLEHNGEFIQFKYIDEEKTRKPYIVNPGVWSIKKTTEGLVLLPTSFVKDDILKDFINTKQIEDIVDCFFKNLHLYKEFGMEVPKRGVLLYGPAGGGKTSALSMIMDKYIADGKTAVVVWATDSFESYDVKNLISTFKYEGVEKLILIAEDLGGMENQGQPVRSDSSLLSLLDNQEKTFTIPVMIIATTNYPENFAANLTNRSGRFDDKIEVGYPSADARRALLKFFAKEYATEEALNFVASNKCDKFPPSQLRESYIRSRLRSQELLFTLKQMVEETEIYNKSFSKTKNLGI